MKEKDLKQEQEKYQRYLAALKKKKYLQENLPHLYGWKDYTWGKEYIASRNRYNFLCAANQISKSTSNIRKAITWATEPDLWPELWTTKPTQFWYLYPTKDVATIEFWEKWEKEILPKGEFKNHPQYGWKHRMRDGNIFCIEFNTGVTLYFKSYSQKSTDLQSGTVYAMFTDEELPEEHLPELQSRLRATNGYFHLVFTATTGQEIWRRTMEEFGDFELFKDAFKRQVSMYDCMEYWDGTPSQWTKERITREINLCSTKAEVDRRIFGKFVVDADLRFQGFTREDNVKAEHPVPKTWNIFGGVDIGTGGKAHPAAIAFMAVSPDYKQARIIETWRGDGIHTTSADILNQYKTMASKYRVQQAFYDWQAKDFFLVAMRSGQTFLPADKHQETGYGLMNTLFKNKMLIVYNNEGNMKLVNELITLKIGKDKSRAKDDLCDAVRFIATGLPWNFESVDNKKIIKPNYKLKSITDMERNDNLKRHNKMLDEGFIDEQSVEEEIDEWNNCYGN